MKRNLYIIIVLILLALSFGFFQTRSLLLDTKNNAQNFFNQLEKKFVSDNGANFIPVLDQLGELNRIKKIGTDLFGINVEKTYIVLFQNSMEIRPTGGFIGSFAKVKIKNARITDFEIFDTGIVDKNLNYNEKAPLIYQKYLNIENWELRDSNFWFSFPKSAENFQKIYSSQDKDKPEGIIGVTSNFLPELLKITGPIQVEGIDGSFTSDNVLEKLEWEVEMGYKDKQIAKNDRKNTMGELMNKIMNQVDEKREMLLLSKIKELLDNHEILIYSNNNDIQKEIESQGWSGKIKMFNGDYLATIDANLLALKSDRCIKREIIHKVDLDKKPLEASTSIAYTHTCSTKDWMTSNYQSYTRFYVPAGSRFNDASGFEKGLINKALNIDEKEKMEEGAEEDKLYWGNLVSVSLGKEAQYSIDYSLPENIDGKNYSFYFQRQPGVLNSHLAVLVVKDGNEKVLYNNIVNKDVVINSINEEPKQDQ